MSSSIVWTVLPTSFDPSTGLANVAVLVTPRIDDAPTVGQSQFANWPATMAGAKFGIVIEGGPWTQQTPIPATVMNTAFDSNLWSSIFPSYTPIKQYQFKDNSTRHVWSYNVQALAQALEAVYTNVAFANPKSFPTLDFSVPSVLTSFISDIANVNTQRIGMRNYFLNGSVVAGPGGPKMPYAQQTAIEANALTNLKAADPMGAAAWGLKRFYDRPQNLKDAHGNIYNQTGVDAQGKPILSPIPRPAKPTFDFHERCALLADHPLMMLRLGLIIQLQFKMSTDMTAPAFIRVVPSWGGPSGYDVTPRTAYERVGKRFQARPQDPLNGDHIGGLVALEDPSRFGVYQTDVDGDGHKMVNYASMMQNYVQNYLPEQAGNSGTQVTPPQESVPARRNAGFQLTRQDRGTLLAGRFTKNFAMYGTFQPYTAGQAGTPPMDLYIDDVTRGYRVDVSMDGGPWQSLHKRATHYQLGVLPAPQSEILPPTSDEGYTKAASATSDPDPNGPTDMYVHERFVSWHGWSLAAPRPGQTLFNGNDANGNDTPQQQNIGANNDFPIDSHVRVLPGSLPALRYGHSYSFRARVVDLACQSLDLSDATITTTAHVTAPQTYQRYEPLPPPVTVLQKVVTEGESVDHMVVRSDPTNAANSDPGTYATYLNTTYNQSPANMSLDPSNPQYKQYAATTDRHVAPPKCSQIQAETHGMFDPVFFSADPNVQAKFFALGAREEGTFMDYQLTDLTNPSNYLGGNPNNAVIITPPQVPYNERRDPTLPLTSSSLVANRGDALAPGEYVICNTTQATLPYLPDPGVQGAVVWDPATNTTLFNAAWTTGGQTNAWPELQPTRLELGGTSGSSITASPGGSVNTILLPPATIYTVRVASTPDQNQINGKVFAYTNNYSPDAEVMTGRHWMFTPFKEVKLVHAVPKPLAAPSMFLKPRRLPDDTVVRFIATAISSHSNSTGEVELMASWTEYNDSITRPAYQKQPQAGSAFRVEIPYGQDMYMVYPELKHELGDTKHRTITYSTVATTRYKEYFPADLIANTANITTPGSSTGGDVSGKADTFQVLIPSTARPKAPKIEYVVPTFFWPQRQIVGTSTRKGGGLRVYMDRPWFSSGESEIIAVLLQQQGLAANPQTVQFTSAWGRDPIWDSKANAPLDATRFLNAAGPAVNLQLQEINAQVTAVPFNVEYSQERGLWFADIVMDPSDTYTPFISLSIARYQPYSLSGLELSPHVRADFAQVLPDRTVNYAQRPGAVSVTVTGAIADNFLGEIIEIFQPSPTPPPGRVKAPRANVFNARIEQRIAGTVGDLGWQPIFGSNMTLSGSLPLNSKIGQWSGILPVPVPNGLQRRLVVEETETFIDDTASTSRVVYMDMILL